MPRFPHACVCRAAAPGPGAGPQPGPPARGEDALLPAMGRLCSPGHPHPGARPRSHRLTHQHCTAHDTRHPLSALGHDCSSQTVLGQEVLPRTRLSLLLAQHQSETNSQFS